MRRGLVWMLVLANVALAVVLATLWIDGAGALRNARWEPPRTVRPDFSGALAQLSGRNADDVGQLVAMADRPLFSPNRRPPPPPAPPAPPDPLANLQLLGVYDGGSGGGIIARIDGRVRRASVNEKIGDWTVQKIADRDVTFARGGETRIVKLAPPRGSARSPAAAAPAVAAQGTPPPAASQMTGAQRVEEEERARLRAINEQNIRNGLPPVTHR